MDTCQRWTKTGHKRQDTPPAAQTSDKSVSLTASFPLHLTQFRAEKKTLFLCSLERAEMMKFFGIHDLDFRQNIDRSMLAN